VGVERETPVVAVVVIVLVTEVVVELSAETVKFPPVVVAFGIKTQT
jgi:hypothetical protein